MSFGGPMRTFSQKCKEIWKMSLQKHPQVVYIYIRQVLGAHFYVKFSILCQIHEKVLTGARKYSKYHYHYNTFAQGAKKCEKLQKVKKVRFSIIRHLGRLQTSVPVRSKSSGDLFWIFIENHDFLEISWFSSFSIILPPTCHFPL